MKNKFLSMVLIFILCLSIGLGLCIAIYIKNAISNDVFVFQFYNQHSFFNTDSVEFLNQQNHYFTFSGKANMDIVTDFVTDTVEVVGTNENFADITKLDVLYGSFFNKIHMKKRNNVVVLDSATAWHFFGNINCVGNYININNEQYQVIGVAKNHLINKDKKVIYMPFDFVDKFVKGESFISEILIHLNNISEYDPLIKTMGYSTVDIKVLEMEQYKSIVMQRVSIIIFMIGCYLIGYFLKTIFKNIKILNIEFITFLKENYIYNIVSFIKKKEIMFTILSIVMSASIAFLIINIIRFKLCLPYYFFLLRSFDINILIDILSFFLLSHISSSTFQYLDDLNVISNVLFFSSILMVGGIVVYNFNIKGSSHKKAD